jgi:glycosyltransferase involved in cell wall biosynthesis
MPTGNNSRLKVLFVATSAGEGGIERYSVRLAGQLRERGWDVRYACRTGTFLDAHCVQQSIPVIPWQVRNSGDLHAAIQFRGLLRENAIDIVHVHSRRDYVPALLGAAPLRRHGLKTILHAHMIRPLGDPPLIAAQFFQSYADAVICVSQAVRDELLKRHRFSPISLPVIPNGVDMAAFLPSANPERHAQRESQRQAWGIAPDAFLIGMVGRLDAKGQRALLLAAPEILTAHPQVQIILVGTEGLIGEQERLLRLARENGIADRVVFAGRSEDIPTVLAALDLFVHLPADESFGLAIAEAMASELPVIASDIGGCREVVCDGVTGILVPLGSSSALKAALSCFLDGPTAALRARRFGAAGRQRVLEEFSFDLQLDRLETVYLS